MNEGAMRGTRIQGWIIVVSLTAFLISCDEGPNQSTWTDRQAANPFCSALSSSGTTAWMSASITDNDLFFFTKQDRTDTMVVSYTDYRDASALFVSNGRQVNPGSVRFNGFSLSSGSSNYFTRYNDLTFDMDGKTYEWQIAGSSDFPAISDSLTAPAAKVRITSHAVLSRVSRSRDLGITWSPAGSQDHAVLVVVQGRDEIGPTIPYFMDTFPDNGSCTIPASTFSGFRDQKMNISVSRGRYAIRTSPDGRQYIMTMYSQHNVDVRLGE